MSQEGQKRDFMRQPGYFSLSPSNGHRPGHSGGPLSAKSGGFQVLRLVTKPLSEGAAISRPVTPASTNVTTNRLV